MARLALANSAFAEADRRSDGTVYSVSQAIAELRRFSRWRTEWVLTLMAAGDPDLISGDLLLAMASRETNMRNIVGGGFFNNEGDFIVTGVDRGLWQVNQEYHSRWLDGVPGCDSGSYDEVYDSALPVGRVPGLARGARKARDLLRDRITYARSKGVPEHDCLRVAVAGYNCGGYWAVKHYIEKGDPDLTTTNGNYSRDVLQRRSVIGVARRDRLKWVPKAV